MTNFDVVADYARRFYEAYERLAPTFGYKTRGAATAPWDEVPENNRLLLTAVVNEVVGPLLKKIDAAGVQPIPIEFLQHGDNCDRTASRWGGNCLLCAYQRGHLDGVETASRSGISP